MTTKNIINFPGLDFSWSNRTHFQYERALQELQRRRICCHPQPFWWIKNKWITRRDSLAMQRRRRQACKNPPPNKWISTAPQPWGTSWRRSTLLFPRVAFSPQDVPFIQIYAGCTKASSLFVGLIGPNVKCMQSMLFVKKSGKPGLWPGIKMSTLYPHRTALWQECGLHRMTLRSKKVVYG